MIPQPAIEKYLNRRCDDHYWMKGLSAAELDQAILTLAPKPDLHPALHIHQKAGFLMGVSYPRFSLFLDMGLGKTILALELMKYWRKAGLVRKALIFVTSDKAFPTWEAQIAKFNIDIPYITLEGSSDQKWRTLEKFKSGLIILTYPGAVYMATVPQKNGRKLHSAAVKALSEDVDALVLDESTRCGNHDSLTYKLISQLAKGCRIRYALAGRPLGRDPTMLWAQQKLIDDGESLGETLGLFRAAFFTESNNRWDPRGYAKNYEFKDKLKDKLAYLTGHRSIAYKAGECIDLPDVVSSIEEVRLPKEARAYHERIVEEVIEAQGDLRAVKNVFLRMRQLSSGYLGFIGEESGERVEIAFEENPKLERLMELVEALPADRKMVIFYEFTWSARCIMKELGKRHLDAIWLWAGTKDYRADLMRFQTRSGCDVAVIQNRVGSLSLDGLQVANYQVFYESPVSVIDREQAEARIRRQGQKHKVFRYDLVVKGTFDSRILEFHREGDSLLEALRRDPRKQLDLVWK